MSKNGRLKAFGSRPDTLRDNDVVKVWRKNPDTNRTKCLGEFKAKDFNWELWVDFEVVEWDKTPEPEPTPEPSFEDKMFEYLQNNLSIEVGYADYTDNYIEVKLMLKKPDSYEGYSWQSSYIEIAKDSVKFKDNNMHDDW